MLRRPLLGGGLACDASAFTKPPIRRETMRMRNVLLASTAIGVAALLQLGLAPAVS
jgi:hypothetical protein